MSGITAIIVAGTVMFALLGSITVLANMYSLNHIKSRTVGMGSTERQGGRIRQR